MTSLIKTLRPYERWFEPIAKEVLTPEVVRYISAAMTPRRYLELSLLHLLHPRKEISGKAFELSRKLCRDIRDKNRTRPLCLNRETRAAFELWENFVLGRLSDFHRDPKKAAFLEKVIWWLFLLRGDFFRTRTPGLLRKVFPGTPFSPTLPRASSQKDKWDRLYQKIHNLFTKVMLPEFHRLEPSFVLNQYLTWLEDASHTPSPWTGHLLRDLKSYLSQFPILPECAPRGKRVEILAKIAKLLDSLAARPTSHEETTAYVKKIFSQTSLAHYLLYHSDWEIRLLALEKLEEREDAWENDQLLPVIFKAFDPESDISETNQKTILIMLETILRTCKEKLAQETVFWQKWFLNQLLYTSELTPYSDIGRSLYDLYDRVTRSLSLWPMWNDDDFELPE